MADDQVPTPSDPPDVKEAKVWQGTIQNCLAMLIVAAAWAMGKIDMTTAFAAIGSILGIVNLLPALLGKKPGQVGVFSIAGKPVAMILGALFKSNTTLVLLVLIASSIAGCAGEEPYHPDWPAIHNTAQSMRSEIAKAIGVSQEAKGVVTAVCSMMPDSPECRSLGAQFAGVQSALGTFVSAVDVYEQAGIGGERVQAALDDAKTKVDDFVVSARKTAAAIAGIAKPPDPAVSP